MPRFDLKVMDLAVFLLALGTIALFFFLAYTAPGEERLVYIQSPGGEWVFPLEEEKTLTLEGPLGPTEIHIHDGSVLVRSSPCREQICVSSGPISSPGSWIACLPNRIFVRIEAIKEDAVDASVY